MDAEKEKLVKLLFNNTVKDEWLKNPDFHKYLSKLGSYTVAELNKEPSRLREQKNTILEQTQELACKNYKTFIETAECSREISKEFTNTELKLDSLLDKIPILEQECENFAKSTKDIDINRRLNSLCLIKNSQLLEILELPQLMESLIKNEQYEDAIELTSFVRRLEIKHPDISLFKSIVLDVEKHWLDMLHQLIAQLQQDLQLPKCLQIVGLLRRMEVFTESELRLKFLQARDCWLQKTLSALSDEDATHHLNKTIEITRINLFNIVTQYRAIFNDDEHNPLNASRDKNVNENLVFYSWLQEKITDFLKVLDTDLRRGVTLIDSIMSQSMYFGLSFSRVGCDFRSLMVPIFTETVVKLFKNKVIEATNDFDKNMETFTLINKNNLSMNWKSTETDANHPPDSLLEFYPLAEYCNQILTAFNELRLCAPLEIISDITDLLQQSLTTATQIILSFYRKEQQAFTQTAKESFTRLCTCFADELLPYLQRCLDVLYPPTKTASHLGISLQILEMQKLSILDKIAIVSSISHLLPVQIEPVIQIEKEDQEVPEAQVEE